MDKRLKEELMEDINNFLIKLEFYVYDCDEPIVTKMIVTNEIERYFKNEENYRKRLTNK